MTWLRNILLRFLGITLGPPVSPAPSCPDWLPLDRDNWAKFAKSSTGLKLLARLRAFEAANALAGARDVLHTSHSAGRSCGYSDCLAQLISLSVSAAVSAEKHAIQAQGETPLDETPEQFVARFSP